ncbi:hypothetical protein CARUB_v10002251mg [Capsella rubella]|uniref:KIB1-4 beta-propeller domain-containing protein n=1 Tax=Capsella rubella TaxID=81985 RepID=R0FHG2_9BRAS|nr:hypothetical protein CARUB_v10002251mg [Capsella rubella]
MSQLLCRIVKLSSAAVKKCDAFSDKGEVDQSDPTASRRSKPRAFVVFRQDPEQRMSCYTEDIGDLCIFLGKNEAFCVSATEYPGLRPNSVYYTRMESRFGFYDLSDNTLHDVLDQPPSSFLKLWLAPLQ